MNTKLINPIKEVRTRHGISQRQVAHLSGMSAQAVMRYEQALYENLSMKLATAVGELDDLSPSVVCSDYSYYREEVQVSANLTECPPIRFIAGEHPFLTFRTEVLRSKGLNESRMAFCILLAIHPATVLEYDSGRTRTMPALIERALVTAGMDTEVIETLKTFGELWYERHTIL